MNWLVKNKAGARIVISPGATGSGDSVLVDHLTAKGHTVVDDDPGSPPPAEATVDLVIHTSAGANPSRFTNYRKPVLTYNGPGHDDELVSNIGLGASTFDPGEVTIRAASHPAAGGKTGSLRVVTDAAPFDTMKSSGSIMSA